MGCRENPGQRVRLELGEAGVGIPGIQSEHVNGEGSGLASQKEFPPCLSIRSGVVDDLIKRSPTPEDLHLSPTSFG